MGRSVIVTGAAGGLGSAVAKSFVRGGDNVLLTDVNPRVADVAAELVAGQPELERAVAFHIADATDPAATARVVTDVVQRWGGLDILINPAGGSLAQLTNKPDPPLWELTAEDWSKVISVNLTGSFNWLSAAAIPMMQAKQGVIVLVAWGTGMRPGPRMAAYAAAKAGVIGLMKAAARDLGEYNIRVNAVNPGLIVHEKLPPAAWGANVDGYTNDTTLGKLSNPEDFARFVTQLVDFSAISGQIYSLDSRVLV